MQKTFEVSGPVNVDIQLASGDIRVDRNDGDKVEVVLEAHDPESQELVDQARVELRGQDLVVDIPGKRGFGFSLGNIFGMHGITCLIRCADHSSLRVRTKSADVVATLNLDRADISTASGDARLENVDGDLSFKGASGDVWVGNVGGRASVNTASGDIRLGHVGGDVSANSASGDIQVEAGHGDVRANTASGDIAVELVTTGEVAANSASGDVSIGVRRGTQVYLDCSTVSGDASSDLGPTGDMPAGNGPLVHLKARTVSGDIHITRAGEPAGHTQEVQA
jgi:DUF4097 and DUF4098 domain-containing protein YvlB